MKPPVLLPPILALILAAFPAWAQPRSVRISTGEHLTFTRLVAQTQGRVAWHLTDQPGLVLLTIDGGNASFATSGAFDRIPRTRLSDLRAGSDGLALILACECQVHAFELRPGVIVVDIADPPLQVSSPPAPRLLPQPRPERPARSASRREEQLAVAARVGRRLARDQRIRGASALNFERNDALIDVLASPLSRQVAAAVSQGLLEPAIGAMSPDQQVLAPLPLPTGRDTPPDGAFLSILDATQPEPEPEPDRDSMRDCTLEPVAARLVISDDGPMPSLSSAIDGLYQEFDRLSQDAVDSLVVALLMHGLGAEARAALGLADGMTPDRTLFLGIADVIDGRFTNARASLGDRRGCGGALAFFGSLARWPDHLSDTEATGLAILFAQMPHPLRRSLGEDLIDKFVESGHPDAARIALDALIRTGFLGAAQLAPIEARVEALRGNLGDAHRLAARHVVTTAAQTQLQHELRQALGRTSPDDDLDRAEAIATAERGTAAGRALMRDLVMESIDSGSYAAAFARLDRLASWPVAVSDEIAALDQLRDHVWQTLVRDASDLTFVETLIARTDWRAHALSSETREALRNRMIALRFGPETLLLLPPGATHEDPDPAVSVASPQPGAIQTSNAMSRFREALDLPSPAPETMTPDMTSARHAPAQASQPAEALPSDAPSPSREMAQSLAESTPMTLPPAETAAPQTQGTNVMDRSLATLADAGRLRARLADLLIVPP